MGTKASFAVCQSQPLSRTDAADRSTIYDEYDAAKALEYLDGGRRRKEQFRDPEGRETGSVEEEDDDADDVVEQTQTGTESIVRRDVPDFQDRTQQARSFGDHVNKLQERREQVMNEIYSQRDAELAAAWRK